MKWLFELAKDKELPKMAKVMVMITYCLWAVGTAFALFGWVSKFISGAATIDELLTIITKLFV